VGEFGLLTSQRRLGTLSALEPSVVQQLTMERYREMTERRPDLALVLAKLCIAYLGHRVMHVSNRIWCVLSFVL
jgi:hypothetical protein